jgi:ERCC4-type nuclease
MILIDDREGSKDLADLLDDALLVRLDFGDAMFQGNNSSGVVDIGVERKTISDLINSISTGRLSGHQLPGLIKCYHRVYLIVEGEWRGNRISGNIEVPRRGGWVELNHGKRIFKWQDIWGYLTTLGVMTGVVVRESHNLSSTARIITQLHTWWTKPWKAHRGHLTIYNPSPPHAILTPLTDKEKQIMSTAATFPGIKWERALGLLDKFSSMEAMFRASEEEWREVPGIGKVVARRVWEALHDEDIPY